MDVVNIAAYRFTEIAAPDEWQASLLKCCEELDLKGNILLAGEGINLSVAGDRSAIDAFIRFLNDDALFQNKLANLEIKESISDNQPFRRMVVRLVKEIITMRHPVVCDRRAPVVDSATLKRWLDRGVDDDGREVVLLDTRNNYEVEIGTFEGAVHLDIERFSEFPEAIDKAMENGVAGPFETAPEELKQERTFVSFCTGGIRCEKAALYMHEIGLKNVFQLDGGILKYFEEIGGSHWNGECFVFDERVALDPQLNVTGRHERKQKAKRFSAQ